MTHPDEKVLVDKALYDLHCKGRFDAIEETCTETRDTIGKLFKIIEGNGSPDGLVPKVASLEEKTNANTRWRRGVVGIGSAVLVAVIVQLILTLISLSGTGT